MTKAILQKIKDAGQDYEWYPTTNEIIDCIATHIKKQDWRCDRILDIGAGNGKLFQRLRDVHKIEMKCYAIEKSEILIQELPSYVFVIGTDFESQTLIDKSMSIIFSNPPYTQFESWSCKIIQEAFANEIYLVIPSRWKNSTLILNELKKRNCKHKVIKSFDFLESEDRTSRAKVDILWIGINQDEEYDKYSYRKNNDPFNIWFKNTFNFKEINKEEKSKYEKENESKEKLKEKTNLVKGQSLITILVELYDAEMLKLFQNYQAVEKLDASILKELGINYDNLAIGLKEKISGLKNLYWNELFSNLDTVTSRLTSKSRKQMLGTLHDHVNVDFNTNNCYAVIVWVIKNANDYFENQLVETYKQFSSPDNIRNYVSNKRIVNDRWRFKDEASHYKLDYRIVWNADTTFTNHGWNENINGLDLSAANTLNDLCTIAKNLNFNVGNRVRDFQWQPGNKVEFLYTNGKVFMECRPYKNGNIHIKLDQEFMKAFNVEAARILKWIKTPEEAVTEMELSPEDVEKYYRKNLNLLTTNTQFLLT